MKKLILAFALALSAQAYCQWGVLIKTEQRPSAGIYAGTYNFAGVQKLFIFKGYPPTTMGYDFVNYAQCR